MPPGYAEVSVVRLNKRPVLCIKTMHPTARGFGKHHQERWEPYADVAERFIRQRGTV